ncbi:MAG: YncE family protein [Bacteroidales bacterium]
MIFRAKHIALALVAFIFYSCMKDETIPVTPYDLFGSRGVFIVNEGNYLYGNASLSYYDFESKEVINNIYAQSNGVPLGDVAYSMAIYKGKGYIVVNNSGCIHIVDANTLQHIGTIENLPSPRHIHFLSDDVALVSDLYARGITIVNPIKMEVVGKIETGSQSLPFNQHPTEDLIRVEDKIFTNCWSYDNKVLVISSESLAVIDSIEVGIQPLSMAKDKNNNIWVMNDGGYPGNPFGQENPSLMRINSATNEVELRLNFDSANSLVGQIDINPAGDSLYFINKNIYRMHVDDSELPTEPFILSENKNFRAIAINPVNNDMFISDTKDYMSEGTTYRFNLSGHIIDTIDVGIIPGSFCFN